MFGFVVPFSHDGVFTFFVAVWTSLGGRPGGGGESCRRRGKYIDRQSHEPCFKQCLQSDPSLHLLLLLLHIPLLLLLLPIPPLIILSPPALLLSAWPLIQFDKLTAVTPSLDVAAVEAGEWGVEGGKGKLYGGIASD